MAKKSVVNVKTPDSEFTIIGRVNAIFENQPVKGYNRGFSPLSEAVVTEKQILTPAQQRQADRIAAGQGAGNVGGNIFEEKTKCYARMPDVAQQLASLRAGTLCSFTCTQDYNKYFAPAKNEWVEDWNIYCSAVSALPDMETAKIELQALIAEGETRRFVPKIREKNKPAVSKPVLKPVLKTIADAF